MANCSTLKAWTTLRTQWNVERNIKYSDIITFYLHSTANRWGRWALINKYRWLAVRLSTFKTLHLKTIYMAVLFLFYMFKFIAMPFAPPPLDESCCEGERTKKLEFNQSELYWTTRIFNKILTSESWQHVMTIWPQKNLAGSTIVKLPPHLREQLHRC